MVIKAFFRYIRGELLNGFYIRALNLVANNLPSLETAKAEFIYWMNVQFNAKTGVNILREYDLKGIAQVAGVLNVKGLTDFLIGWFLLSESHVVGGKERSERGLLNQTSGLLEYYRTDLDTYVTDISTIATENLRMALIPDGVEPIGYVWNESSAVLLETGKIDPGMLHATPPAGYVFTDGKWEWPFDFTTNAPPIYAPWYGDQYLPLTSSYFMPVSMPDNVLTYLLSAQQMIKYNGLGLKYLLEATAEIIPDLIYDLKLEIINSYPVTGYNSYYHKLTFSRHALNFAANNGWGRFSAWGYFVRSKYPFIQFNNTGE